mmetsp:Transcript_15096/g.17420  ORF Transcript_15096/g.17420 Transcript_15096/m.17420 type:complete len:90 (+) Transcript_15096:224-493(+)
MYEAWRLLKRNPIFYNPRLLGFGLLGYVGANVYFAYMQQVHWKYEDFISEHPEEYNHKLRKFNLEKNKEFTSYILSQRGALDHQLQQEH